SRQMHSRRVGAVHQHHRMALWMVGLAVWGRYRASRISTTRFFAVEGSRCATHLGSTVMAQDRIVMGLLFFPRGGSAYVVRYLSPALARAGWSVSLAVGSLGVLGEQTHALTFF